MMRLARLGYHYWHARRGVWGVSRMDLEEWQHRQAMRLVRFARRRSPYYRELWAELRDDEWRRFPIIDKRSMMANLTRLNTRGIDADAAMEVALAAERTRDFRPTIGGVTVGLSSGTSGNRGLFLVSDAERAAWAGTIMAKALPRSILARQRIALFLRANSNLYTTVAGRRLRFEFFDLARPVGEQVERLNRYAPTVLLAPPAVLRILADDPRVEICPERVLSIADVLEPLDRVVIERRFGGVVHQVYQATEGFLGVTCEVGRIHLNEDLVAVQLAPVYGTADRFTPIVTDLNRRVQPIVRYALDDVLVVAPGGCRCGSPMIGLDAVEGRADDVLLFRGRESGEPVPIFPDFIRRSVLLAVPDARDYRVRQTVDGSLAIWLDLPGAARADAMNALTRELAATCEGFGAVLPPITPGERGDWTPGRKLRRVERLNAG